MEMETIITKTVTVSWSGLATMSGTATVEVPADWTDKQILEHCNNECFEPEDWDVVDIEMSTADGVGGETDEYVNYEYDPYLKADEEIASDE